MIPQTMRAVRVHKSGGSDELRVDNIPVPSPGPGQALVRVEAAGVNFIDVYKRTGMYKIPLPTTLGEEGAGAVVAVGDDVNEIKPGDRVAWALVTGAYADYAVVRADRLVPIPANVSAQLAAAIMLQGMTAHYLATSTYPLKEGDTCLVHAAAGGVGLLLVQIAKMRGATVIGTAGSEEKADLARNAGADHMIVYTKQDFVAEVKRITNGSGVNVVYDSVGATTFMGGLDVLGPRGTMALFGQSSGAVGPLDPQILNQKGSLFLTRPTLAHYALTREELLWRSTELFNWVERGKLDVRIGGEYPLEEVANAHDALEGRRTTGKLVIRVSS
ncbi:MAG TPA: quinone oxidoreductase [Gemmatimonadaceae bacterium]|nr:quinone oxidoreductase [Gemmatimonadaceae bacterium]